MESCIYCSSTENIQTHSIYSKRYRFLKKIDLLFCKVCHDKMHDEKLISKKDLSTVYNSKEKLIEFLEENKTVFVARQGLSDNTDKQKEIVPKENKEDIF